MIHMNYNINVRGVIHLDFNENEDVFNTDDVYIEKCGKTCISELIGKYPLMNVIYENYEEHIKELEDINCYLDYLKNFRYFNFLRIKKESNLDSIIKILSMFNIDYIEYVEFKKNDKKSQMILFENIIKKFDLTSSKIDNKLLLHLDDNFNRLISYFICASISYLTVSKYVSN